MKKAVFPGNRKDRFFDFYIKKPAREPHLKKTATSQV